MVQVAWLGVFIFPALFGFGAGEAPLGPEPRRPFDPDTVSFRVRYGENESSYRVNAAFVMPGETWELRVVSRGEGGEYDVRSPGDGLERVETNRWRWRAPRVAGDHEFVLRAPAAADSMIFHVFVLVPAGKKTGEYLNGYRVGQYPAVALNDLAIYRPPAGFLEVTEANVDTPLSPHFTLRQFLCKQEGGYPKYAVLREPLLLKLEAVLAAVNGEGFRCDTFHVMSGYRTPFYNKAIGNVKYSRHCWGGAADIFIDEAPCDDMMDDLNGDGRVDYRDADVLYEIIDGLSERPWYAPFVGGLARYKTTPGHGPFVHIDVRGFHARWGT